MSDYTKAFGHLSILYGAAVQEAVLGRVVAREHLDAVNAELLALERLRGENERLREALEEISDPVAAMRARAKAEGGTLDGIVAARLAADGYFRGEIARKALIALAARGEEGPPDAT